MSSSSLRRFAVLLAVLALASLACEPTDVDRFFLERGRTPPAEPARSQLARIGSAFEAERDRRNSFVGSIDTVDETRLGLSWRPSCPVTPAQLRLLRLSYWGFDDQAHVGELIVNVQIAERVVGAFREMWNAKFPINTMVTAERFARPSDFDSSGTYIEPTPGPDNVNDTSAFFCRPATGGGPYSQHAYGLAIDINPVQNPYIKGFKLVPTNGAPYLDRANASPGMNVKGSVSVRAMTAAGLTWGGTWGSLKDYMHFSLNGR